MPKKNTLTDVQKDELLATLQARFAQNPARHESLEWDDVRGRLETQPDKLAALFAMEQTGGEPDVTGLEPYTGEVVFADCAAETPAGRRSLCYDAEALNARKANKPQNSAVAMAEEMGVELMTEAGYRDLQQLGAFDEKTSSWVLTPPEVRALGGALFCDRRYGQVFTYHNGADSYYAARGFRATLRV